MAGGLPDVMGLDDVNDLVDMGVMLGRAVPASKWVDGEVAAAGLASFQALM